MGYDYFFLITGDKDGQTHELKYLKGSGTYGATDLHYFFNHPGSPMNYQGTRDMGQSQYVNRLEDLRLDYLRIHEELTRTEQKIKRKFGEFKDIPITRQTLDDLIGFLEKKRSKFNEIHSQSIEELYEWTEKCDKYESRGYSDIKLIYGFYP